jgi:hypothetical protein
MIARSYSLLVGVLVLSVNLAGCGSGDKANSPDAGHSEAGHHDHPTAGPHGGGLIELGNEEYHAELVHDDQAGTVTIYVLDSAAKASVPIEATEVTINLKHDDQAEQFKLAAAADQGDPAGKSSRFVSSDAELAKHLDHEDAAPQLVLTINGKQYRGAIEHDHGDNAKHGEAHSH